MKKAIHPKYYEDAIVTCACGAKFSVGSTEKEIHVEICSACHPFFTGKEKLLDTAGRVDKFRERQEAAKKFRNQKSSEPVVEKTEKKADKPKKLEAK